MSSYRFSMAPNISVPRSKFHMPFNHVTSFLHGKLVPIDCFEILPGDEFKLDMSAVIRMSTPIAPIFGNIKARVHAFFVPMRLVWSHTAEFYGENKTNSGYQTYNYQIPQKALGDGDYAAVGSVSHYLGKPINTGIADGSGIGWASVLKERCYGLIWSEYYRAQQIQNPFLLNTSDSGDIGTFTDGSTDNPTSTSTNMVWSTPCLNVCKQFDYFTACTTQPQYGSAVTLPLGTSAPVKLISTAGSKTSGTMNIGGTNTNLYNSSAWTTTGQVSDVYFSNSGGAQAKFIADLSNATAASINSIRYAFACQKWLERANFGSRFFEMLNLHYGVTSPDSRLQRPEYLGGKEFWINVDQVISTAGYAAGSSQEVGQTGAVSVTGMKGQNIFHKAFVEPGYVMVLISCVHERSYSGNIMREDSRKDRWDFYFPEFCNLGDQSVYFGELMFIDSSSGLQRPDRVFGYQEHWAEYRYRPNRVSGLMDPYVTGALDYWTLSEKFNAAQVLSNNFIMENRDCLTRCLVSGATGPDYIGDFYFDYTAVREMPLYTIPGLVDHFGVM